MKRRILSLTITCVMLLGILPVTALGFGPLVESFVVSDPVAKTEVTMSERTPAASGLTGEYDVAVTEKKCIIEVTGGGNSWWSTSNSADEKAWTKRDPGESKLSVPVVMSMGSTIYVKVSDSSNFNDSAELYAVHIQWNQKEEDNTAKTYTASLTPETTSVITGERAEIAVHFSHNDSSVAAYNAYDLTISYDATLLFFDSATPADSDAQVKDDGAGTLRVVGYGADKSFGTPAVKLRFTARNVGTPTVTLTEARVDSKDHAIGADAPEAAITTATATIQVGGYSVTLPGDFTGDATAVPGQPYTFTAKDKHYDYTIKATVGGSAVDVIDNGDGTFTILHVTGPIAITTESKTAKAFAVTLKLYDNLNEELENNGQVTYASTATYLEDYTFTIAKEAAYTYTVSATVNGKPCDVEPRDDSYTIAGTAITGPVEIAVFKRNAVIENTAINFDGSGATDVMGAKPGSGVPGQPFAFQISKVEGYVYTVSVNGTAVPVGEDGSCTIPGTLVVGSAITVTVTKEAEKQMAVAVAPYLQLKNGSVMYRITVTATLAEGTVPAYDGTPMFRLADSYTYLVIATAAPAVDDVKAKITEVAATATDVDLSGDVNGTGRVDINDAQLVYDVYNGAYDSFDALSMEKFLRANVNDDATIDVRDCVAIVHRILTKETA